MEDVVKALITGITGQDGSYLSEFLLDKGYEVHGLIRQSSNAYSSRIAHILDKVTLHYGDMTDGNSISRIMHDVKPTEIYNLAAQSQVRTSFEVPEFTADVAALGALRVLDAMRDMPGTKFYQAGTSEMFGRVRETPQNENTPFYPRSPYGVAKQFAHWTTVNFREAYGMFACNGIMFNHESPRRGETFASRKITKAVARIKLCLQDKLVLGNLDAKRDWGYAKEYVEMMWKILQQDVADDYVIGTGETHTVKEFVELAFDYAGLDWKEYVQLDSQFVRPSEVDLLVANPAKAQKYLGWEPKVRFTELVKLMVDADLEETRESL